MLSVVLVFGIALGVGWYTMREGHSQVGERAKRLVRWAAPLAIVVAVVRLIVWIAASH